MQLSGGKEGWDVVMLTDRCGPEEVVSWTVSDGPTELPRVYCVTHFPEL